MDLQVQLGGSRIDSAGLTVVTIDPAIAAIIGQSTAVVAFSRTLFAPLEDVKLVRSFHESSLNIGYSSGVSPGSGIYLTSRQNTNERRVLLSRLATLGQSLPPYTNYQAGAGLNFRVATGLHIQLRYDYRHYSTQYLDYKIDSNRVSIGMAYSPGGAPLAIW
jgi:hypothetical protein